MSVDGRLALYDRMLEVAKADEERARASLVEAKDVARRAAERVVQLRADRAKVAADAMRVN